MHSSGCDADAVWEEVVQAPVMCKRKHQWDSKFFPQEEGREKVPTSFVDI